MKVAVTSGSFSKNKILRAELLESFSEVEWNDAGEVLSGQELVRRLQTKEAAIIGLDILDQHVIDQCPELKYVAKYGVGLDNIDLDVCRKRGIFVGWSGGVNKLSVAELVLGMMLSLCRNFYSVSLELRQLNWIKNGGFQLSEKTVGIIGLGHVGKEVCRLLKPFNCKILYNDIVAQNDYAKSHGLISASKEEIFSKCDVVTLHIPFTAQTHRLVNLEYLNLMKKTAFLINTSRGPIVRQSDLKKALIEKTILGAAIDVYEEEPPTDRDFLSLPNLLCTPHIGGNSAEAVLAMGRSAIENLKKITTYDRDFLQA